MPRFYHTLTRSYKEKSKSLFDILFVPAFYQTLDNNAANGTKIPTDGRFETVLTLKKSEGRQHNGRGFCYVIENHDVFGWEWIQKKPDLVRTILSDLAASRCEKIVAKL